MQRKQFRVFFDRLIPAVILESRDYKAILRSRVLVGLFISNMVIAIFMLLVAVVMMALGSFPIKYGFLAAVITIALLGIQVIVFYKIKNPMLSAIIFSMTFFVASLGGVVVSGGWYSPVLILFFCSPAVSFLVDGREEGMYAGLRVCLCGIFLMLANRMGFLDFQIIEPESIETVRLAIWISSVIFLVSCLTVYDLLLDSSTERLSRLLAASQKAVKAAQ